MPDRETDGARSSSRSECPYCRGRGVRLVMKTSPEIERMYGAGQYLEYAVKCEYCDGAAMKRYEEIQKRSNIPERFTDKTIDDFDWSRYPNDDGTVTSVKDYVRGYLINYKDFKKNGTGLYIWSKGKGTGKTFLASCIANQIMQKHAAITKFIASYQLIDMVKNPDRYSDKYGINPLNTICTCEILIIDDIGQKVIGQEWSGDILYQITDERYKRRLITIYTSNFDIKSLPYDDRITDRIYATTQAIPLRSASLRDQDAAAEKKEYFKRMGMIGGANAQT